MTNPFDIDPSLVREALAFDRANPLLFNTGLFLLLFVAFMGIYRLMGRWR